MNHRVRSLSFAVVFLGLLIAAPAVADDDGELGSPLGEIKWGDGTDAVVKKVRTQMLSGLTEREELRHNRVKLQRERKRVLDRIEKFEKSHTKLGSDSGYRVSVIADEYLPDNGESIMRLRDKVAQRYYFFLDGRFYKMLVAYNPEYLDGVDFEAFVVQTARKYGEPSDTYYSEIDGEEQLTTAVWQGAKTLLKVDNQMEFYDTYTMSFADREVTERLAKIREARGGDDDEELSSRVQTLTDFHRGDDNDDAVDSLVGETNIDLNEGRPVDEQVRHGEGGQAGQDDSVAAQEKASKPKKKKKKRKKKKKKKRDFSDIDTSSDDDDLIIY